MRISDWSSVVCSSDLIPSDPLCETEGGMMIGIADQCINRWPTILPQFGISPSYLTGKQTPCPTCGGKDRFRFDNKDGRGTYYCNKCGPGDGVQLVMMKTGRSEEHTSELQSLLRISYAVFCLKKKKKNQTNSTTEITLRHK